MFFVAFLSSKETERVFNLKVLVPDDSTATGNANYEWKVTVVAYTGRCDDEGVPQVLYRLKGMYEAKDLKPIMLDRDQYELARKEWEKAKCKPPGGRGQRPKKVSHHTLWLLGLLSCQWLRLNIACI